MKHSILFSGHMIDSKNREKPRFPASKEMAVRNALLNELNKEKINEPDNLKGFAGAACGGDIIFHEICLELGIETKICLALPVDEYEKRSVMFAGSNWARRFNRLIELIETDIMPLEYHITTDIWSDSNLWMLERAIEYDKNITLIALLDSEGGDRKGGTKHMVDQVKKNKKIKKYNLEIKTININTL